MNLRQLLSEKVARLMGGLHSELGEIGLSPAALEVLPSDRPDLADYQCNAAMALGKALRKNPRAVAEELKAALEKDLGADATVSIAGPGFVNIVLSDAFLLRAGRENLDDPKQGYALRGSPREIMIDFGGPNIAKELHIGHLRPHLIGDSLQRLLRFAGERVTSDIHMGDWGTPIGMIIAQLSEEQPELGFFAEGGEGDPFFSLDIEELGALYRRSKESWDNRDDFKDKARLATEALQSGKKPAYRALWKCLRETSLNDVKEIYRRLGISFDLWLGESDVNDVLPDMLKELIAKGFAREDAGAIIIPAVALGFVEDAAPMILQKGDGGYTYAATDLATIKERVLTLGADTILYVVDNRQKQHFEQVFAAAKLVGYAGSPTEGGGVTLVHVGHGTINGKDGRPFKTRDGKTVRMKDVLDIAYEKARAELPDPSEEIGIDEIEEAANQIGMAAVKFQEYINSRISDYVFDMDNFTGFEGKTGPYLQYAAARCGAILAKAAEAGFASGALCLTGKAERDLLIHLLRFPEAVVAAAAKYEPSLLAAHAYKLAQLFSSFYAASPVMQETDEGVRASRLRFVEAVSEQMGLCFKLLNMKAPPRMLRKETPKESEG